MAAQDSISAKRLAGMKLPAPVIAKLWLHMYQFGPVWVRPIAAAGTLSNVFLACANPASLQRTLYAAAALAIGSIFPITFMYFEPGINGAGKWRAQTLLRDEGFSMPHGNGIPSVYRHSASSTVKKWAEKTDMADIVARWGNSNNGRWIVAATAAVVSGYATLCA